MSPRGTTGSARACDGRCFPLPILIRCNNSIPGHIAIDLQPHILHRNSVSHCRHASVADALGGPAPCWQVATLPAAAAPNTYRASKLMLPLPSARLQHEHSSRLPVLAKAPAAPGSRRYAIQQVQSHPATVRTGSSVCSFRLPIAYPTHLARAVLPHPSARTVPLVLDVAPNAHSPSPQ